MIELIPPYVRGEPREYMSVKEFVDRYANISLMNTGINYLPNGKTLWLELYDIRERDEIVKNKEPIRYNLDVVFFCADNVVYTTSLSCLRGRARIELENQTEKVVLKYDKTCGGADFSAILSFTAEKVGIKKNKITISYKDAVKACDVCGREVTVYDENIEAYAGHGTCEYCGWYQNKTARDKPEGVFFSNLISLSKAKRLLKEGKPPLPSLKDFTEGFFFGAGMQFDFEGRTFDVSFVGGDENYDIEFGDSPENVQIYKSEEEFMREAHIDGKLLKDIWDRVKNASYI